jgi:hypothetical protein
MWDVKKKLKDQETSALVELLRIMVNKESKSADIVRNILAERESYF